MKLLQIIQDVRYVFRNENNIFLQKGDSIEKLGSNIILRISPFEGTISNGFIYKKNKGSVDIIDIGISTYRIDIKDCFGVRIVDYDTIFLNYDIASKECTAIFNKNKIVYTNSYFWGIPLSKNYRLNYAEGAYSNPVRFRCSDLLDEHTYWEYDCGEGFVADKFYLWNDNLVFVKGGENGSILLVMDLLSGRIIWQMKIPHGAFNIDKEKGLLVSVWGNKHVGNNFQIIDLANQRVISERIETKFNFENVNVHWQQQYLHQDKLYFTDNVNSYGDDLRPIKFGCFDIETKKVDFLQEVPDAAGGQFAQTIYHEGKLYLRTSSHELFIFEEK